MDCCNQRLRLIAYEVPFSHTLDLNIFHDTRDMQIHGSRKIIGGLKLENAFEITEFFNFELLALY